jgi:flagellar hook-basal body complex protein FliE
MSDPLGVSRLRALGNPAAGTPAPTQELDRPRRREFDIGKESAAGSTFGDTLAKAIGEVSAAQDRSADYVRQYLAGEPVELHQVMAAAEEAGLALDLLIELRNKVTDAYRTLINMQS